MSDLWERDACDLADAVRAGAVSARDLLAESLDRLDRLNPELNAFCYEDRDAAVARAGEIDAAVARGEDPGPLAGVPIGVKELEQVGGWPDTHASKLYADATAKGDAVEVARLRRAGAVTVGLTTSPEFGSVSFTASPLHGVTRNPWDTTKTPGGSSGGSAAAVAAGIVPMCTGSDGGGSIRIPASYCGLFGFKVTFGRIGKGPSPFDASLHSVSGPIVRSARDAGRYVDVTAGPSPTDPTSLPRPTVSYESFADPARARERLQGVRVGWSDSLGFAHATPDVVATTRAAFDAFVAATGAQVVDVDASLPEPGIAWALLSAVELAAWHMDAAMGREDDLDVIARLGIDGMRAGFPMRDFFEGLRYRHAVVVASAAIFDAVDLLFTPTTPTPAFPAEGVYAAELNGSTTDLFLYSAPYTAIFNMTGQPAVSVPAGLVDGLPIGVQIVGRRLEDDLPLSAGALLESVRPWPRNAPLSRG